MRRALIPLLGMAFAVPGGLLGTADGTALAQNRQPISVSLAECGAIFAITADRAEARGTKTAAQIAAARRVSLRFVEFAIGEAEREGRADPGGFIAAARPGIEDKWQSRFAEISLFRENMDWVDYCAALGKNRGVLPLPD